MLKYNENFSKIEDYVKKIKKGIFNEVKKTYNKNIKVLNIINMLKFAKYIWQYILYNRAS